MDSTRSAKEFAVAAPIMAKRKLHVFLECINTFSILQFTNYWLALCNYRCIHAVHLADLPHEDAGLSRFCSPLAYVIRRR